jgi:hypothetical protein
MVNEALLEIICAKCSIPKDPSLFYRDNKKKNGLQSYCKDCCNLSSINYYKAHPEKERARSKRYAIGNPNKVIGWALQSRYGITLEERDSLLLHQGGVCAICKKLIVPGSPCVDHNHQTGKIRGVLCNPCNRGIAFLKEDIAILQNAILYLNKDIEHAS